MKEKLYLGKKEIKMIAKERLIEHINSFPDHLEMEELIERLLFIEKLEERIKSSDDDDTISEQELDKEMA